MMRLRRTTDARARTPLRPARERPLIERPHPAHAPARAGRRRPLAIHVHEVTKTYELGQIKVRALRRVSLRIERGDFVAIMGSSGAAARATLMNILGCLDIPTNGQLSDRRRSMCRASTRTISPTFAVARSASSSRASTSSPRTTRDRQRRTAARPTPGVERSRATPARGAGARLPSAWPTACSTSPVRALRRPAAARRGRTRDRHQPDADPRRRADREPRLALDRGRAADLPRA